MSARDIALITGSSRGIGAAIAVELAAPGRTILINFRRSEKAAKTVLKSVVAKGAAGVLVQADVTDPNAVGRMFDEILKNHGGLDTLVINSGVPFEFKRISQTTLEDMQTQWRSQVQSAYLCCRRALPLLTKQKKSRIVFVLSTVTAGLPPAYEIAYVSAKYALMGFARALAAEVADKGIQIHLVSPGMTQTDFIKDMPRPIVEMAAEKSPLKRLEKPEEAARLVGRLVSGELTAGPEVPNLLVSEMLAGSANS